MLSLLVISLLASDADASGSASNAPSAAAKRLPNIVFVIADDLGYGDLGCFGSTKIRTPNLDALAARGVRLTQHYAGNAVCAPARCVLMTGLHPGHAEIRGNREIEPEGQWPIADQTVTLAERLKAQGYATGAFGKWGLGGPNTVGDPLRQGFDRFYGYNCQRIAHNFYPVSLWSDDDVVPLRNRGFAAYARLDDADDPNDPASYEKYIDLDFSADLIAKQAVAFVHQHAGEPFFLFHPTTIPHLALSVPKDELEGYDFGTFDTPYPGGKGYLPSHRPRAMYAAMITRMDKHVGQIVAAVEEEGLLESTLFVFTSDNGPAYRGLGGTDTTFFNSHGGLRGRKGDLYEGGVRVPTIVAGPGVVTGVTSEHRSGFEDWIPTLFTLAGLDSNDEIDALDGEDFAPSLQGQEQQPRGPLYREFPAYGGQQAVWDGRWKAYRGNLTKRAARGQSLEWELYDLDADPDETTNVAAAHPDVVQRLDAFAESQHVRSDVFPMPALDK